MSSVVDLIVKGYIEYIVRCFVFFAVIFEFLIVSGDIKWSGSSGGTGI